MKKEERIAEILLETEAVFLRPAQPFVWASGIVSPIYCDNRLTLSYPAQRQEIEQCLAALLQEHFPECEMLMGTSTAGIPHAAIVAHLLEKPMGYVRSDAKNHGRENNIEGRCLPHTKVVVIEDLISTAGSVCNVVTTLREAGADVLGVVAIFNYGMQKAKERFASLQVKSYSLSDYDHLLQVAVWKKYISRSVVPALLAFREDPSSTNWKNLLGENGRD